MEGDVGEEVEAALVVLLQESGLNASLFLGSEGVEVAAHVVEAAQDMVSFAPRGALEDSVFHEMGETVLMRQLITGAGLDHKHEMGDFAFFLLMYDADSVGKDGFIVFVIQHSRKNRLQRYDNFGFLFNNIINIAFNILKISIFANYE